ncbi:glutamine transport ATP-binding protein GlnQ [Oxobacter pfennigii]|uniref:Glutamine transport ATP-binding protein GlnQ n=1 Tax=Oxobacter pfennigii TaxID=36849 RepID=A0A0P8WKC2_9CLOT|nr:ATP-binding cassette domain-containing protein [Oxobacter pfennigii]KPU42741.1 glutamine transport ATP-binding protein GlnQ [Oxobacter pfennigii]
MDIYVENAYKEYGKRRVMDVEDLKFEEGNIYALLGLNGSGKSTLLECISGVNRLSGGSIYYNTTRNMEDVKNNISIMMQKPYLFNLSVMDNIKSGLKYRKFSRKQIDDTVDKYFSYFNIEDLLDKNGKRLSGGESAKVALLRTAVLETEVTLLDEPTASMDIESTLTAEKLIADMAEKGRLVIMVTHDLNQAKRIASKVVFMDRGKVIEAGDKTKVLNNPDHRLIKLILNI